MELHPGTLARDGQQEAPPVRRPLRTWAGHGTGIACNACGAAINEKDIEYEVELSSGSDGTLHFHFNCYQDWMATQREAG